MRIQRRVRRQRRERLGGRRVRTSRRRIPRHVFGSAHRRSSNLARRAHRSRLHTTNPRAIHRGLAQRHRTEANQEVDRGEDASLGRRTCTLQRTCQSLRAAIRRDRGARRTTRHPTQRRPRTRTNGRPERGGRRHNPVLPRRTRRRASSTEGDFSEDHISLLVA